MTTYIYIYIYIFPELDTSLCEQKRLTVQGEKLTT